MTAPETDEHLEQLLEFLKRNRGFDFTGYKRPSLARRLAKRTQALGLDGHASYLDYLEVHPEEFARLFDTVLINVTAFFRDPASWEYLSAEIVPRILASKAPGDPIRIWSAGTASGEEAYSLAMVLAEALGLEQFRLRVKIYATDLDEDALARARAASYGEREVTGVPHEMLAKYFEATDTGQFVFRPDLRRSIIFGRHDLIQDAPISRVDLLVCRNALMYFNAETQSKILGRFHFALADGGFLFLGKAETLLTQTSLFSAVDLKRRFFQKAARPGMRDRVMIVPHDDGEETAGAVIAQGRVREAAFDTNPIAQLVVDVAGNLALANERARAYFGLGLADVGRPLQDLSVSYRPVELRSLIDRVYADGRALTVKEIAWSTSTGETRVLEATLALLSNHASTPLGVSITFADVTKHAQLQQELERSNQELETAYEELQSTNEELETTNEELQATVEELETTNEELQSTNEELETMNEELQSTNEELQTINDEVRRRSEELNEVNAFLESILASLRGGVAVVDRELCVLVWNQHAVDLWGLRPEEALGRHFLNLDIGLPASPLQPLIRNCLSGESPGESTTIDATNRRGRSVRCDVTCTPLVGADREVRGVILVMETVDGA